MQNGDEASPNIILAGRAHLVKMLITLELHGIFSSNVACSYSFTLSRHWYAKQRQAFIELHFGQSWLVSENVHSS